MTNLRARRIFALKQRVIHVGSSVLGVLNVALLLQNSNRREYGVVSQRRLRRQPVQNLLNAARPFGPKDFHDPQFSFGQGCRRFGRQCSRSSNFSRRGQPRKVTNYLVAGRAGVGCMGRRIAWVESKYQKKKELCGDSTCVTHIPHNLWCVAWECHLTASSPYRFARECNILTVLFGYQKSHWANLVVWLWP